jgi:plastocyanin
MAALVLLMTALAGIFPLAGGVAQTPTQEADEIRITLFLEDIRFTPEVIEIPANQPVTLRIENIGAAKHSFVVPDLGIDVQVQPGRFGEITLEAQPGEYEFICTVPGHKEAGMVGTLRVGLAAEAESTGTPSHSAFDESSLSHLSARELLPEAEDLDGNWRLESQGKRSRIEVSETLGEGGEDLLLAWGWQENAFRDFLRLNRQQFAEEATYLDVSIHDFADSAGAASALQHMSQWVVDAQGLDDIPVGDLEYNARVLTGPGDGENLTVVYVQLGNFLIRVGASSEAGDPTETAVTVAKTVLAKGTQSPETRAAATVAAIEPTATEDGTPTPQATAVANVSPASSPVTAQDKTSCEGLPGYSQQVLAIETEIWDRLVAEFSIDREWDLFFLDEEQFADLATIHDWEAAMLAQVEAPGFAEDWHQSLIASVQLDATIARLVPQFGNTFAASLQLWEVNEILDDRYRQAYLDIVADCPIFETLWIDLSQIDGDAGTPPEEGPDYSSCPGLEQYESDLERAELQTFANRPDLADEYFALADLDEEAILALPPVELIALSMLFEEIGDQVAGVTPPEYALEWHLMQGFWYDLFSSYWLAAAGDGFEVADEEIGMQIGVVSLLEEGAIEKATEECAVFADFAAN